MIITPIRYNRSKTEKIQKIGEIMEEFCVITLPDALQKLLSGKITERAVWHSSQGGLAYVFLKFFPYLGIYDPLKYGHVHLVSRFLNRRGAEIKKSSLPVSLCSYTSTELDVMIEVIKRTWEED